MPLLLTSEGQMDLLQSSRPRHPHSFHSQNHPRPALRVLIAFEVFGSIDPLQAFLDHFEPSHGFDYSMMMPPREGASFDDGEEDAAFGPPAAEGLEFGVLCDSELTERAFRTGGLPGAGVWTAAPAPLVDGVVEALSGTSTTVEQAGQRIRFPAAVSGTFSVLLH